MTPGRSRHRPGFVEGVTAAAHGFGVHQRAFVTRLFFVCFASIQEREWCEGLCVLVSGSGFRVWVWVFRILSVGV